MKSTLKTNLKSFYKFINSKRRACHYPSFLKFCSRSVNDDLSISNVFADFFDTTFDNITPYSSNLMHSSNIHFTFIHSNNVLSNLRSLNSSSCPDGIPSCILKHCAETLYVPLTDIFNKSIELGYLPRIWKKSFIIPLFKSGSKLEVSNYRGIAKLNAIPKLLEKILLDNLSHQVSSAWLL
ncbi:hypothetical protein FF38_14429 [Lucilia cuprina]|uniref:Reverse transcriptase domain-containing protein n=1 Tax=Lucilia cuprina TaxID=7375 RepID=A0A0L0CGC2_LUCCU|nr:hypothetical protein FF38_14429 [Lucilia cuprina]